MKRIRCPHCREIIDIKKNLLGLTFYPECSRCYKTISFDKNYKAFLRNIGRFLIFFSCYSVPMAMINDQTNRWFALLLSFLGLSIASLLFDRLCLFILLKPYKI